MHTLKYDNEIDNAIAALFETNNILDELELKLDEISVSINSRYWQGASFQRSVEIHDMVNRYYALLKPFCGEIHRCCTNMKEEVQNFEQNSSNIKKIRSI
jgi:hypothetical protein